MARADGGRLVQGELGALSEALENYFGAIAEIKEGLRVDLPEKPDALVFYEQVKELRMPLVEGAIMDQPHIWMMEYKLCDNQVKIWNAISEAAKKQQ